MNSTLCVDTILRDFTWHFLTHLFVWIHVYVALNSPVCVDTRLRGTSQLNCLCGYTFTWHFLTHLIVWIHVYVARDTFLFHVGPAVPRHPLPLALRTFVLSEASPLTLVGC
jgi:hypothetical protein